MNAILEGLRRKRLLQNLMKLRQFGIMTAFLLTSFALAIFLVIGIFLTQPVDAWLRDLRLLGLSFNVAGALTSVIPRALRDLQDIEALSGTYWGENPHFKKWLLRDTRTAQSGMVILGIGFALQLLGNLA